MLGACGFEACDQVVDLSAAELAGVTASIVAP
jgi:hypothetical protein